MKDNLIIEDSIENFDTWIDKNFVSDDIKPVLRNASILLVPTIGFREENQPTFPVLTEDLFNYLKENLPDGIIAELCINDEQYLELALHSDYKRIGKFIVKAAVVPIFVTVLSSYIYDKYVKEDEKRPQINIVQNIDNSTHTTIVNTESPKPAPRKYMEPSKVKFSITVVDTNGVSKEYKYEGPAKDVKDVTNEIKSLWENDGK